MTQLQQKITLPAAMAQKLDLVRRRTFRVRLGTAMVAAAGVLLAAMALAMSLDWMATLYDFRSRAVLSYSAWVAAGVTLAAWSFAAWRHTRRVDRVAAQVDREIPEIEERWSTVTELATNGQAAGVHPAMFQQVSSEAQSWTPQVDVDRVVPLDNLIRALLFLTAITSVLGIAVLIDSQRTTVLLKRFWRPFAAISATELTDLPGDLVVGRGEALQIDATLVGAPVGKASLLLKPLEGDSKTITLKPRGENQEHLSHRLRSVKEPLRYRLRAGDGQTPWYEIVVADRPRLAQVRLQLTPPAYTHKAPKVLHKLPRRVTALEGSRVAIAFKTKQAVQSLQLKLGADLVETLTADEKGWYRWETTLTKSFSFQPLLTESHGLGNLRPPTCELKCRADKPPVVKILTPNSEMAVRPDDTVPVTFVATDDVGVLQAELVVYDESRPIDGKPRVLDTIAVPLGDQQGAAKVTATVELDLSKYQTTDGSELSFSIRVREDRGQSTSSAKSLVSKVKMQEAGASSVEEKSSAEPTSARQSAATPKVNDLAIDPADALAKAETPPGLRIDQSTSADSERSQPAGEHTTPKQVAEMQASTPASSPETSPEDSATAGDVDASDFDASDVDERSSSTKSESEQTLAESTAQSRKTTTQPQAMPPNSTAKNSGSSANAQSPKPQDSSRAPGNPLSKRGLDTSKAQTSNSKRMRLKIDEWAGSYDAQQRQKLEIAIAPRLEELDRALEKAQRYSRAVLDEVGVDATAEASKAWASKHDRDVQRADEQIESAIKVVEDLEKKTYDTPYAFIGLQLVDISQAHIGPARRDFWKALQSNGTARVDSVRNGWQHTSRARELLVLLTERFERAKTEYQLADSVEKIKKMYQVFVEDSMALLRPEGEGGRYRRKTAEFDLDEEYLKRLEEVLKMRNEMRAELARILAEDPRLLRRYLDAQRNRQSILRNDLDQLIDRQNELNRETRAWTTVEEDQRPQLTTILLGRHVESVQDIALAAADLQDRFETWSPLGKEVEDADFQGAAEVLQQIATATRELSTNGLRFVADSSRVKKVDEEAENSVEEANAVEKISSDAQQLYERYTQLEVLLRRIGGRRDRADIAFFATNRLLETRRLVEQTSAWIRQLKQQQAGNYHRAAEVAQYRLATETDSLAGKLADLEQQMAGLLQTEGGMLPKEIAEKARDLLASLDEQAAPNQLAAVYALRRNQLPRATSRQESALKALELAGRLYDEMIEATIKQLDKLPVQDPIASLLDDPTLDELLRQLEQEVPLEELLGIPRRPTNLQVMSDWLRPGSGNAGMQQRMIDQMQRQQKLRQRQLELAYRRAVARALKEAESEDLVKDMPKLALETGDWNRLASQLEDDLRQGRDKAPPERYRRAIEQYFRQVSSSEKEFESTKGSE